MNKKHWANGALAFSLAGAGATSALAPGFFSELIHHGFIAASIGGLADWFAVTALFRKPLGIGYRTEILKNSRPRITEALVRYAAEDILSVHHIMTAVNKQNLAALFLLYLKEAGGKKRLKDAAELLLEAILEGIEKERLAKEVAIAVKGRIALLPWENLVTEALQSAAKEENAPLLLDTLAKIAKEVLTSETVQELAREEIAGICQEYQGENGLRGLFMGIADLSEEHILELVNERLANIFEELETKKGNIYDFLLARLTSSLKDLSVNEDFALMLRDWKQKFLGKFPLEDVFLNLLEESSAPNPPWKKPLFDFLEEKLEEFERSKNLQEKFDGFVKEKFAEVLNQKHVYLGQMIKERLDAFSDEELTEFVEGRVAEDLSMIRINGAVVGSLAGMGLYVLEWLLERLWGLC